MSEPATLNQLRERLGLPAAVAQPRSKVRLPHSRTVRFFGGPFAGKRMRVPVEAVKITIDNDEGEYRFMGDVAFWCRPWTWRLALRYAGEVAGSVAFYLWLIPKL